MKAKYVKDLHPYNTATIVTKDLAMRDMVELFVKHSKLHILCVIDERNQLLGLVDRRHLFHAIFSHHVPAGSMVKELYSLLTSEQASDLLIKHVITCKETDSIEDVIQLMINNCLDAVPVLSTSGKLEGVISIERLFKEWLK